MAVITYITTGVAPKPRSNHLLQLEQLRMRKGFGTLIASLLGLAIHGHLGVLGRRMQRYTTLYRPSVPRRDAHLGLVSYSSISLPVLASSLQLPLARRAALNRSSSSVPRRVINRSLTYGLRPMDLSLPEETSQAWAFLSAAAKNTDLSLTMNTEEHHSSPLSKNRFERENIRPSPPARVVKSQNMVLSPWTWHKEVTVRVYLPIVHPSPSDGLFVVKGEEKTLYTANWWKYRNPSPVSLEPAMRFDGQM
ncbi:hypothetical protein QBC37DRAFT_397538 [Rhypophila decipiens]|uniref:Uncharacterized protein n=1 Tax=Rhypophila decipiens TaxID=261697 RepID=A0AAN6YCJ9_9PEZI|nr:hypothetical protein QBC37DRAFT_397538 [Rhypophila decipiens]